MNVFYLDPNPATCARMHCDKHTVKMILEYSQLLSTAHHILDGSPAIECYKMTHKNHPSAVWARSTRTNYAWLHELLACLCAEYTYRYGRVHATQEKGIVSNLKKLPANLKAVGKDWYDPPQWDEPPQCMPDHCKVDGSAVAAYRKYYLVEKQRMLCYTKRITPDWILSSNKEAA